MEEGRNELKKSDTGYSSKSLVEKLGLKKGMMACIIHPPPGYFIWLGNYADTFDSTVNPPYDFVHVFVNTLKELEESLFDLKSKIKPTGMIWISWFKKSSGWKSEITEDLIRDTCIPLGLVDIKVCAVSEEWSGLKLVIRKRNRR